MAKNNWTKMRGAGCQRAGLLNFSEGLKTAGAALGRWGPKIATDTDADDRRA
jgi:hypothetical protein